MALIELNVYGKTAGTYSRRFDAQGDFGFMQRENGRAKQSSPANPVCAISFIAPNRSARPRRPARGGSSAAGALWNAAAHTVLTCEGQRFSPDLDSRAPAHIERRQSHASAAVSIAWLEAPEGSQLLLVANENFCTWQPTEKNF
ncbi:DUF1481 domain-containing protein [Klebsiella pneumoniae]|uniref:DUF1481 domain-containing protein n=1 Tax=Klebsiella pneumoniae TaxID=573 RepID=UPI001F3D9116|nr:DUF1481 domain-containing protein [Klebsiella pneumoniae]